jgi:hypothetical protein
MPHSTNTLIAGYADAGYMSDPHKAKSRSGYVFTVNGTAFSWKSTKQNLVATSSNHAEIIALYETARESTWIREMVHFINKTTGKDISNPKIPIYEDNSACIHQIEQGYIRGDKTKHIRPKFFYTHELLNTDISLHKISSTDNLADLFTKSLPSTLHRKYCKSLGIISWNEIQN